MIKKELLIIGAGLSGLYTAYLLQDKYNITIIEARDRLGGRISTISTSDLGPSWVWMHHTNIIELIKKLDLEVYSQYDEGLAVYEDNYRIEKFIPSAMEQSYRIIGGMYKIIDSLKEKLNVTICIKEEVREVIENKSYIKTITSKSEYQSDLVISTLPPRLVIRDIIFSPTLDIAFIDKFNSISTWMAHCQKYVIEYDTSFWKKEGLSGFGISHVGPLSEIHDSSTASKSAIMGFVHRNIETNEKQIIEQLIRLFGNQAQQYKNIYTADWKNEKYTATSLDSISEHPNNEGMFKSIYNNRVKFIGTETASLESGYLEGAVVSAKEIVYELFLKSENSD